MPTTHNDLPRRPDSTPTLVDDSAELAALIEAGGFWRLAPDWVPRDGYVASSRALAAVATRLRRLL